MLVFQSETGLTHIHHHVTGVLSHGIRRSYAYTWTDEFPSNCNITLNCLMLALKDVATVSILFYGLIIWINNMFFANMPN